MKIAIDISQVAYPGGVANYTKLLVEHLLIVDKLNQYILFAGAARRRQEIRNFLQKLDGNFTAHIFPIPPKISSLIWNDLHILALEKLIGKIDVFHSSDWAQPPSKAYNVTTVHDLTPIKFPESTHPGVVKTHTKRLQLVKDECDQIIVPSQATKTDLIQSLGFPQEIITVIPEAPNPNIKTSPLSRIEATKKKYRIHGPYLLTVGTNPRKNLNNIFLAFEKYSRENEIKLVQVGSTKSTPSTPKGVIQTGFISDNELTDLYSGSEALVYPSLYEGFGLPILEAFVTGTPVITSNTSSMSEIAADAAILVNPNSVEEIKDAMGQAIAQRATLVSKGTEQLKKYSWDNTAKMTIQIYNKAK